jgi:hypothetical protein
MPKTHSTPTPRRRATPKDKRPATLPAKTAPSGQLSTKPRRRTTKAKPSTATKPSTAEVLADPPTVRPKRAPSGQVSTEAAPVKAKAEPATKPSTGEVVPALLSKHELAPMIDKARKYGRDFEEAGKLWAIELHRLQEAKAHLTYGRESFGSWAATEFADIGLTKDNANKLSQHGRVILLLQSKGRVDLKDPETFPGTTGTRALTSVLAKHGEDAMLQVFDAVPADSVVASTVLAAADALLPPPPPPAAPPGAIDHEDDPEEPEEIPKPVQDLRDHVERLHDYLHDISCADDADPIAVSRSYDHFLQDAQALKPVLDAVLPAEGAER